ncbi:hypothetical protein [Erythrobacter rubeus]|uniref:Lipoprotein n=1 Tax=Erythrobacter rubeus TaxID=2760803 RepID=A0ABR8KT22_9SPHN|nr:hypothetical protein [Erythrobacter rubeus]MBD2841407.1 hypothetical protein [Erythrobacter rubeus]
MKIKQFSAAFAVAFGAALVSGCGNSGPDLNGAWVTASMRDAMECQMGRVMVINEDKIVFGIAGRVMKEFGNLETQEQEDGTVVLKSDAAKFEIRPGEEPGQMTLLSGPVVAEHHTTRLPKELARC